MLSYLGSHLGEPPGANPSWVLRPGKPRRLRSRVPMHVDKRVRHLFDQVPNECLRRAHRFCFAVPPKYMFQSAKIVDLGIRGACVMASTRVF